MNQFKLLLSYCLIILSCCLASRAEILYWRGSRIMPEVSQIGEFYNITVYPELVDACEPIPANVSGKCVIVSHLACPTYQKSQALYQAGAKCALNLVRDARFLMGYDEYDIQNWPNDLDVSEVVPTLSIRYTEFEDVPIENDTIYEELIGNAWEPVFESPILIFVTIIIEIIYAILLVFTIINQVIYLKDTEARCLNTRTIISVSIIIACLTMMFYALNPLNGWRLYSLWVGIGAKKISNVVTTIAFFALATTWAEIANIRSRPHAAISKSQFLMSPITKGIFYGLNALGLVAIFVNLVITALLLRTYNMALIVETIPLVVVIFMTGLSIYFMVAFYKELRKSKNRSKYAFFIAISASIVFYSLVYIIANTVIMVVFSLANTNIALAWYICGVFTPVIPFLIINLSMFKANHYQKSCSRGSSSNDKRSSSTSVSTSGGYSGGVQLSTRSGGTATV